MIKNTPPRKDAEGTPVELVEYPAPDGTMVQLPTWVVAALEELQALKAAAPASPDDDAARRAAAAPVAPVAAAPVAAAPVPGAAQAVAPVPARDGDDEEKETEDAFRSIRRKLDRLGFAAGLDDAIMDSADPRVIARAWLSKVMPSLKTDKMDARELAANVNVVSSMPARPSNDVGPWGGAAAPKTDAAAPEDPETAFLKRQGYGT